MRNKLLKFMPEFDLIQDAELKEKTLHAWETALQESGWTLDELAKMPFTLLINPCSASFIEHTRAVTLTAIRSAEVFGEIYGSRLPVDMDLLVSGGLLHDIGKLYEYEKGDGGMTVQTFEGKLLRHPFSGMALAARLGLPAEIQHIIATHAGEGDKVNRITEATIINHADFMNFHSLLRLGQKKELAARMG
jgi:putative nucleotidyltransferase with HDIG domain